MKNTIFLFSLLLLSICGFSQQIRISQMPTFSGNTDDAYVPAVIDGSNVKIRAGNLATNKVDSITITTSISNSDTIWQWKSGIKSLKGYIPKGGGSAPILTSANFSSFTGSQRVSADGNTLFDIMDANTGQYFTATKATHFRGITITDDWVNNVTVFKKGSEYWVRNLSSVRIDDFGAKPDFNSTTGTGTDNTAAVQAAVNALIKLGGGDLIVPVGKWLVDSTVYCNSEYQVPINIVGEGFNGSYAESDTALKGSVIYRKNSGAVFKVNLNQNNRYYSGASYTYKAFGAMNLTFYGMNAQTGIKAFELFRTRMKAQNLTSYKTDYLIYAPDADGFGNDNYCDQNHYKNIHIFASRHSGLKMYKNDGGLVEDLTMEVGTSTTMHLVENKSSSSTTIRNVVVGNAGTGTLLSSSSLFYVNNCTNPKFEQLHLERIYMEYIFDVMSNTRGLIVDGYYPKFTMNGGFNFSFDVRNTTIKRVFALATPSDGYADFNSNSLNIDGLIIEEDDWRDADQNTREFTKTGTFNSSATPSLNNMLTVEKHSRVKAINELKYLQNYAHAQRALSGGGTVTYDIDSTLHWSAQFISRLVDRNITSSTFFRIFLPNAGDTIFGIGSTPMIIVPANRRIKLATDNALIFVHKTKLNADSGRIYVINRNNFSANQLPLNSILIASKNTDDGSINLGTGHVMVPGSVIVEGRLLPKHTVQAATNVNTTINARTSTMILNEGGNNGAVRTLTLKVDTTFTDTDLWIVNYNNSSSKWIFNESVKDYANSNVDTIQNLSTYHLRSRGPHWMIIGKYAADPSGGGGGGGGLDGTINDGNPNRIAIYSGAGKVLDDAAAITAARALISDANGIPTHSSITATILGYLAGLSGNVADSLTALRNRLAENNEVDLNFYRPLAAPDSIKICLNDSCMAVYAPLSTTGTFTTSAGTTSNVSSIDVDDIVYTKNGAWVTVDGVITVTTTNTNLAVINLPLPFSKAFTSLNDVRGFFMYSGSTAGSGRLIANILSDELQINWAGTAGATNNITFHAVYPIIP